MATHGKCRRCEAVESVSYGEWGRASHPKCGKCGGMLDRMDGWVNRKKVVRISRQTPYWAKQART